ncbi:MAG: hypothetical protein R2780_12900 [Crocinitomicaceae bacterium]
MRSPWFILIFLVLTSCYHDLRHEKYVNNATYDTLIVINPDLENVYTIYPGQEVLIYTFEILDTKQEQDECRWLGDSLSIRTIKDSICKKSPYLEENWTTVVSGPEKERIQKCTFTVLNADI